MKRVRIAFVTIPVLLLLWMSAREASVDDQHLPVARDDDHHVPNARDPIGTQTADRATDTEQHFTAALAHCNADTRNNKNGHVGCLLLKDAVVTSEGVVLASRDSTGVPSQFPPIGPTRHHMKVIRLIAASSLPTVEEEIEAGYIQSPVIGAQWENAWHTIADFFVMVFHTVAPLLRNDVSVTWFTRVAAVQLGKGCSRPVDCAGLPLFDPFMQLFSRRVRFLEHGMRPVKVRFLFLGLNTRCSPIPTEHVGTQQCHENLRGVRDTLLRLYQFPMPRLVSESERRCPALHVMSRQGDKYRHLTPFPEFVSNLREAYATSFPACRFDDVEVVRIHRRLSFRDQIASVYNRSVLVAGRGGGTALSIFLPEGGLYVSVSGFDRWSPYRDLVPRWLTLEHVEVSLVSPEDWRRPPPWFGSGKNRYIDPNRAAYLVEPVTVSRTIIQAVRNWSRAERPRQGAA